jgi:hypothetical protein
VDHGVLMVDSQLDGLELDEYGCNISECSEKKKAFDARILALI